MDPLPARSAILLLLGALACPRALGADDPAPATDAAAELLAAAETAAKNGAYAKAHAQYKRLAKEFPDTPAGRIAARRAEPSAYLGVADLVRTGPSANRVDVVVMGDGFTLPHLDQFESIAKSVPKTLARAAVFEEYEAYFNYLRAAVVSAEDGVDEYGRTYDTALNGFRSGGIQGQVAVDRNAVHGVLAQMPEQDGLAIAIVKLGELGTGGGGVATVGGRAPKTTVHEWGHAFANLMDEYSANTGERGQVSSGPNVAATDDPKRVPWRHWLEERVSGIGVYQGADGRPKGAWKPTNNCIMDVGVDFCPVCREAIVLAIYRLVDPIEEVVPPAHDGPGRRIQLSSRTPLRERQPIEFTVRTLRPKSHSLEADWYVVRDADAPPPRPGGTGDRSQRGALASLPGAARKSGKALQGRDSFTFDSTDFEPGLWRVVCRVKDGARPVGAKEPWVLADPAGLLESERVWWIEITQ